MAYRVCLTIVYDIDEPGAPIEGLLTEEVLSPEFDHMGEAQKFFRDSRYRMKHNLEVEELEKSRRVALVALEDVAGQVVDLNARVKLAEQLIKGDTP